MPPGASLIDHMREVLPDLNKAERRVAQVILGNIDAAIGMTTKDLSEQGGGQRADGRPLRTPHGKHRLHRLQDATVARLRHRTDVRHVRSAKSGPGFDDDLEPGL